MYMYIYMYIYLVPIDLMHIYVNTYSVCDKVITNAPKCRIFGANAKNFYEPCISLKQIAECQFQFNSALTVPAIQPLRQTTDF